MGLFGKKDVAKFDYSFACCVGDYSKWGEKKEASHNVHLKEGDSTLYFFKVGHVTITQKGQAKPFPAWPSKELDFELPAENIGHIDFNYRPGAYRIYTKNGDVYVIRVPEALFEEKKSILENILG